MYPKTKQMRIERRAAAEKRQAEQAKLSVEERIAGLDRMFGKGEGARRERARLAKKSS